MQSLNEIITRLENFLTKYTDSSGTFFNKEDLIQKQLKKVISALIEFDKVKYAPETDEERKEKEKIVNRLKAVLESPDYEDFPLTLSSQFDEIKKVINEHLEYYSEEQKFCYWRGLDEPLGEKPPGFAILCNDTRSKSNRNSGDLPINFKDQVIKNLNYISLTDAGKQLFTELLQKKTKIEIFPTPFARGNRTIPYSNSDVMGGMAQELRTFQSKPGDKTIAALAAAISSGKCLPGQEFQWLTAEINKMPLMSFSSEESTVPFLNPPISVKDIEDWINGDTTNISNLPTDIQEHIINATIATLFEFDTPNVGSGSVIFWNCFPDKPINSIRPPAIGLAHEFVHAYYNAKGVQPSYPDPDDNAVLGEYITIGLGPWKNEAVSENAIRKQWSKILEKIPEDDEQNRKDPGLRLGLKKANLNVNPETVVNTHTPKK